ncbi:MAG: urease accessory protein UreD [Cellvibrionaceae bacterium]
MTLAAPPLKALSESDHSPVSTIATDKRWLAKFAGEFVSVDGHTRMGPTEHCGPLRVQRPFYPEGLGCLHLYLLHPPGGLVGGDRLSIELAAEAQSHVLMTTPSAGKVYRNISDLSQGQHVTLSVADGAQLEYLPQENIIFDGADAELTTEVDISGSGLFIGWEITCLGRFESREMFERGRLTQSLMVRRAGRPLFSDRLCLSALEGEEESASTAVVQNTPRTDLQKCRAGFQGFSVFGSFVISTDVLSDAEGDALSQQLLALQESVNNRAPKNPGDGKTQLALTQKPGVFIARILGNKAETVRNTFEEVWRLVRPQVVGRKACPPRIWRT